MQLKRPIQVTEFETVTIENGFYKNGNYYFAITDNKAIRFYKGVSHINLFIEDEFSKYHEEELLKAHPIDEATFMGALESITDLAVTISYVLGSNLKKQEATISATENGLIDNKNTIADIDLNGNITERPEFYEGISEPKTVTGNLTSNTKLA